MGALAPLFLGGLALLILPWFIHRIRRPEREQVTFGSLMFVPNIQHEVIERRRVQHILLMLLRMVLLLLLALSFMRPFFEVLLEAQTHSEGVTYHAIVMDASLSMATSNYWAEAKKQAHAIVNDLKPEDQVGIIACGISGDVLAPLSENKQTAHQAIDAAQVRWEKMNFATALQSAEHMLSAETKTDVQRVVHLISDFQASGLPDGDANWQLPAGITLDANMVGAEDAANVSIDALTVRVVNDSLLQIRARIKTWSGKGDVKVQLTANGQVKDTRTMNIPAGNASQAVFVLPRTTQEITGSVEILSPDALLQDNKRFFAHQAKPPHHVVVWPSPDSKTSRSFDRLISAAVPPNSPLPWRVETSRELTSHSPAVVITANVTPDMETHLKHYVMQGGKLFLPLKDGVQINSLNALLLGSGVQIGQVDFAKTQSSIFEPISWVDLNHPIFVPFKGALFNDFSSVRYHNYYTTTADSPAVVPARFENGKPAIIDVSMGLGRVIIWTGGIELNWSNLARSPRFVPLVHETLRYLSGTQNHTPIFTVGDNVPNPDNLIQPSPIAAFAVPGIYRWANGQLAAVNVDAHESNPVRLSPSELDIRLSQAPVLYRGAHRASLSGNHVQREEFGYWGIVGIFVLLVLEQVYSAWLRTHHSTETAL